MSTAPATSAEQVTISKSEFEALLERSHTPATIGVFQDADQFKHAQRVAQMLVESGLVPEHFRGQENLGSAVIAVDMAFRLRMNPLMVMQQLYVVHGKPGWSAQFVIAVINASGRFTPIRFRYSDPKEREIEYTYYTGYKETRKENTAKIKVIDRECVAFAKDLKSGEILEGTPVSIELAVKEGWYRKAESKWPTMGNQMLAYRSASFWGRIYAPEMFMGLPTTDEIKDTFDPEAEVTTQPSAPVKLMFEKPEAKVEATPQNPPKPESNSATSAATTTQSAPSATPASNSSAPAAVKEPGTPQEALAEFLVTAGVAFDDFRDWAMHRGLLKDADSIASFSEVPTDACEKLRADTRLLAQVVKIYGAKPGAPAEN